MSWVATLAQLATEAMGGQAVHISSTGSVLVEMVKGGAKAEAHSHPDGVINSPSVDPVKRLGGYSTMLQTTCC